MTHESRRIRLESSQSEGFHIIWYERGKLHTKWFRYRQFLLPFAEKLMLRDIVFTVGPGEYIHESVSK